MEVTLPTLRVLAEAVVLDSRFRSIHRMKNKISGKILVVEDDPHISMGLVEVLKSEGYSVAACHRGDTAVSQFTVFKPDLVILDVMLPGASGFDLCKEF